MKRLYSLFLAVLVCSLFCAKAEYKKDTVNNMIFTGEWSNNAIVVEDDSLVYNTVYFDYRNAGFPRDSFYSWSVSEDLKIIENATDTDQLVFTSIKPGKSRITYAYKRNPDCGDKGYHYLYVYKHFDAGSNKYKIQIEGPECVGDTEVVVYSVSPILTRNINSGVGVDMYDWNITYPDGSTFADSVYVSADSSSITFKTSILNGDERISVRVGRANEEFRIYKELGHAAPKPIVEDICKAYDDTIWTIDVYNKVYPDLDYNWDISSQWDISYKNEHKSQVEITSHPGDTDDIGVISSFSGEASCGSKSKSIIHVSRSWGTNVKVSPDTARAHNNGEYISFYLAGSLPKGVRPTWYFPLGNTWETDAPGDTNAVHRTTLHARPVNSTRYIDTLWVREDICGHTEEKMAIAYIAPARVAPIAPQGCLVAGETDTFHITTIGVGPDPIGYQWYKDGVLIPNEDKDSLVIPLNSNNQRIAVRALGQNGCHADSSEILLSFKPARPSGIIFRNEKCVAYNMPDILKFSVANPTPYQKYAWTPPSGWRIDSIIGDPTLDTCVQMISNGVAGTHTLYVKGINENSAECSMSDSIPREVPIASVSTTITYDGSWGELGLNPRKPGGTDYYWYMLYNDSIVIDGLDSNSGRTNALSETLMDFFDCTTLPTGFTIVFEYKLPNGCDRARITYGTPISSDFTPAGYTTVQNIIDQLPTPAPLRRKSSTAYSFNKKLLLSPNPTNNTLHVKFSDEDEFDINIYNTDGELVYTTDFVKTACDIDVSQFPTGNYIVVANQKGERVAKQKFIKN